MAVDMFLKLADIKGESVDSAHKGEIDVLSWSWGMNQSGSTHGGGGSGTGKVNVHDISITKYVDSATPNLVKFCCSGKHLAKATLVVRKAGDKPLEYVTLDLEDIIVSGVSTGGSGGADRLTETLTLNFGKFKMKYVPQKKDGSGDAAIEGGYDISGNVAV